jgi:hypothetical protein
MLTGGPFDVVIQGGADCRGGLGRNRHRGIIYMVLFACMDGPLRIDAMLLNNEKSI